MARPIRVEFPGAVYHVMARGNERRATFRDDQDRRRFLETLEEMVEPFEVRVYAYCLMPKPGAARSNNRASGEMLRAEFASLSSTSNEELDGLMRQFRSSQPEFHAAYVAAREIVDNPGGRPSKNGNDSLQPTPPPPQ